MADGHANIEYDVVSIRTLDDSCQSFPAVHEQVTFEAGVFSKL